MKAYVRLKGEAFRAHRRANTVQTVLLFGGMLLFLAAVGFLLAGGVGLLWSLAFGLISFALGQRLGPVLLLRLYGARPLSWEEAPGLYRLLEVLAERAELERVPMVFYVPSAMLNAFSMMLDGQPVVGVTDGLLRALDRRELAGVLAHEIGHICHRDLTVMGLADVVSRLTHLFSFIGQILLVVNLPLWLLGQLAISWALILLLMAAPILNSLLQLALSRTREFDADLEAVRLTGDPEGYISALEKIEYQGVSVFERIFLPGRRIPVPSLLRTHPDTAERIARIRSLMEVHLPPLRLDDLAELLLPHILRIGGLPRWRFGGLWY